MSHERGTFANLLTPYLRALEAALHEPTVQKRLKSLGEKYANLDETIDDGKVYKAMAIMAMLTGEKPEGMRYSKFPWKRDGGEFNPETGFDPLSYSPTVVFTSDKKLRPITRSSEDTYYLLDCRVYGPGEGATPAHKADSLLDIGALTQQVSWTIRLPFQTPVAEYNLLKVAPPSIKTDEYFSHSDSS